jgi:hypothetical protein
LLAGEFYVQLLPLVYFDGHVAEFQVGRLEQYPLDLEDIPLPVSQVANEKDEPHLTLARVEESDSANDQVHIEAYLRSLAEEEESERGFGGFGSTTKKRKTE